MQLFNNVNLVHYTKSRTSCSCNVMFIGKINRQVRHVNQCFLMLVVTGVKSYYCQELSISMLSTVFTVSLQELKNRVSINLSLPHKAN